MKMSQRNILKHKQGRFVKLLLLAMTLEQTMAYNGYYATYIPTIADQIDLPIDTSVHTVNIDAFTSTSPDAMTYEIVHSFDSSDVGSPDIQFVSGGPSLTISMNQWPNKFAVCVVYKDTNVDPKYYGCSPFFVEPLGASDPTFCTTHPTSCYCSGTCISDFSQFCSYSNYVPGTQADLTIKVDQANAASPVHMQIAQWTETEPALSTACSPISDNVNMIMKDIGTGTWNPLSDPDLSFDKTSFIFTNSIVDRSRADEILTLNICTSNLKKTCAPFTVTIEQDCSNELNAELDANASDWLYTLGSAPQTNQALFLFQAVSSALLTLNRKNWSLDSPELFQVRSGRTSAWCEANRPVYYAGFSTDAVPSTGVQFDAAANQLIVNWDQFTGAGTFEFSAFLSVKNDDGLDVAQEIRFTYALCDFNCQVHPNVMYLINSGTLKQFPVLDNTEMNNSLCLTDDLKYDSINTSTFCSQFLL